MYNSIIMLTAGTVIGILGTILLQPNQEQLASSSDNKDVNSHLKKISYSLDTLHTNITELQNLAHTGHNHATPTMSTSNQPSMQNGTGTPPGNEAGIASKGIFAEYQSTPTNSQIEPTEDQILQYQSIETQLFNSAHNKSENLSHLINNADVLTNEQRQKLTDIAMRMINKGEIVVSQFEKPVQSSGY